MVATLEHDGLVRDLGQVLGPANCLVDPDLRAQYETDWTRRFSGTAALVARPGNVAEVSATLAACARHGFSVVPQGGNTGLVGGSIPGDGEVVLSTRRLDRVLRIDPVAGLMWAEAGVTLAQADDAAAGSGPFEVGVDLASRASATLGGMVATNAGGIHVVRHGAMRARLAGAEAVLADGSVVSRLGGLVKDNVGYDLVGLLAGSEGTLAVVTQVVMRLARQPTHRVTALAALRPLAASDGSPAGGGTRAAVTLATELRGRVEGIEALELMLPRGIELVRERSGLPQPPGPDAAAWLLVEAGGNHDPTDELAEALLAHPLVLDTAVADSPSARAALWAYRERHTEVIAMLGIPHKLDVCLPIARLADFEGAVSGAIAERWPDSTLVCFGHVGDGNLHVNLVGPDPDDYEPDDLVLRSTVAYDGSISAEHGIGRAKLPWLHLARTAPDLAAMRAIKHALDPAGLLNPGVRLG